MNKVIPLFIIFALLIIAIVPTGESEVIDYQPNKKFFSYLDLCNKYIAYNQSENKLMSELADDEYQVLPSNEYIQFGAYKPSRTILWNESHDTDTINLITEYVFNLTQNHEIELNVYYENTVDNSSSQDLTFYFSEYINSEMGDNTTSQYRYITRDGKQYNNTLNNQSIYTRTSNLYNDNQHFNVYNNYHKQLHVNATLNYTTAINSQNFTIRFDKRVRNGEFTRIRIPPETFIYNQNILYSHDFVNFGIIKNNKNDTIIIDRINIKSVDTKKEIESSPFLEYYEFHHITELVNESYEYEHELMSVDLVENDYENLIAHSLRIYLYQGTININQHHLRINFDGTDIVTIGSPFEYSINSDYVGDITNFIGYQIYMQYGINPETEEGFYTIYFHFKWGPSSLNAPGSLNLNWTSRNIIIRDHDYLYLANLRIHAHSNSTDFEKNYIQNSRKFDVIDKGITKINIIEGIEIVITQDLESGGSIFPGSGDLKKMFNNIIVTPITTVLNNIANNLNIPIKELVSLLTALQGTVSALKNVLESISTSFNTFTGKFDALLVDIDQFLIDFGLLKTRVLSDLPDMLTGITATAAHLNAFVITDFPAFLIDFGLAVDDIDDLLTDVIVLAAAVSDLPEFLTLAIDNLTDIFAAIALFLTVATDFIIWSGAIWLNLLLHLDDYLILWFSYFIDLKAFMIITFDITFSVVGLVMLYNLIFAMSKFNESGDFNDLWAIAEVYMRIADMLFSILRSIFNFIGGITP